MLGKFSFGQSADSVVVGSDWQRLRNVWFSLSAMAAKEETRAIDLCLRKKKALEVGVNS